MSNASPTGALEGYRHVYTHGHRLAVYDPTPDAADDNGQPPLVLLHGICMTPRIWPHVLPQAYAKRRCIAIGLPAHYPSRAPDRFEAQALTPAVFSEGMLAAVTSVLGDDARFDILGHALGGYAALAMAAAAPKRVNRIAAISPLVQGRYSGMLGFLQWLARNERFGRAGFSATLSTLGSTVRAARVSVLSATMRPRAFHSWPANGAVMRATVEDLHHGQRAHLRHVFAEIHEYDLRDQLARIAAPTLVMHGTSDPIVPFSQARIVSHRVEKAQFLRLNGIGHMPFGEATATFNQSINEWFAL